jgi:dUTPase
MFKKILQMKMKNDAVFLELNYGSYDLLSSGKKDEYSIWSNDYYEIQSNETISIHTSIYIKIPDEYKAYVTDRSTITSDTRYRITEKYLESPGELVIDVQNIDPIFPVKIREGAKFARLLLINESDSDK